MFVSLYIKAAIVYIVDSSNFSFKANISQLRMYILIVHVAYRQYYILKILSMSAVNAENVCTCIY